MDTYLTLSFCLACLWTLMGGLFLYFVYRIMKAVERPVGRHNYGPSMVSGMSSIPSSTPIGSVGEQDNADLKRLNEMLDTMKAKRATPKTQDTEMIEVHEGNLCEEVLMGTDSPDTIRRMSGTNQRKEG